MLLAIDKVVVSISVVPISFQAKDALHEKSEFGGVLGAKSTLPSFLVHPNEVAAIKFR